MACLILQPITISDPALTVTQAPGEKSIPVLLMYVERMRLIGLQSRPHVYRALVCRCTTLWSLSPQHAGAFLEEIVEMVCYQEPLLNIAEVPSDATFCEGLTTRGSLSPAFARVMALLFLQGLSDSNTGWKVWVPKLVTLLLRECLQHPPNALPNTAAYGRCLRSWQALAILSVRVTEEAFTQIHRYLWRALKQLHTPTIRFYMDMFAVVLCRKHPRQMFGRLLEEISQPKQSSQTMSSLVSIAGYAVIAGGSPVGIALEPEVEATMVQMMVPWMSHSSCFTRTIAQLLVHALIPRVKQLSSGEGGDEAQKGEVQQIWHRIWTFLDSNPSVVKVRRKQLRLFNKFDPMLEIRVERMLEHKNQFNEMTPRSLVELVQDVMTQLYDELYEKQPPSGAECVTEGDEAEVDDDVTADLFENIQRKIDPDWWSKALELGTGVGALAGEGQKRQQLIVCASLIDKVPNLAGLTRTCEVFAAQRIVLPDLRAVKTDTFQQICATSSEWVPIEEVSPKGLQTWLHQRRLEGYEIIGVEQTAQSEMLNSKEMKPFSPRTVLLLGTESQGIPVELLRFVDRCVEIPQLGRVRSLNVHVSGAIAIWEYSRQQMQQLDVE